uniref:Uncharacterized protein n=1 Tax=Kalanchoe fedtschenkoi TaxID=63787 RepID=A0A7N0UJE5_KALFE
MIRKISLLFFRYIFLILNISIPYFTNPLIFALIVPQLCLGKVSLHLVSKYTISSKVSFAVTSETLFSSFTSHI